MQITDKTWKLSVSVWAVAILVCWVFCLGDALELVKSGQMASIGIAERHDPPRASWNSCDRVVEELVPGSPLQRAGVLPGEEIIGHPSAPWRWDCPLGTQVAASVGAIDLEVHSARGVRKVRVIQEARSIRPDYLFFNVWQYILAPLTLAMGWMVALRKPRGIEYRALATFFMAWGSAGWASMSGGRVPPEMAAASSTLGVPLMMLAPVIFALRFPQRSASGPRVWIERWCLPLLAIALIPVSAHQIPYVLGRSEGFGFFTEFGLGAWFLGVELVQIVLLATALVAGYRTAEGQVRQRMQWVLTAFIAFFVGLPLGLLGWQFRGWLVFTVVHPTLQVLGLAMLTYAILRHRVFDFGFAVNRTAVYSATTLVLLIGFGLLEWASEHLLKFGSREESAALDAGRALAVFLAFHRIRDWVQEWIDHLFFRQWRMREDAFRREFRRFRLATRSAALLDGFEHALARFTADSSVAIYLKSGDGDFELVRTTDALAPAHIDENAALVLAVREAVGPIRAADVEGLGGFELALPMGSAGWPVGLVVESEEIVHSRDPNHRRLVSKGRVWPMPVVVMDEGLQGQFAKR